METQSKADYLGKQTYLQNSTTVERPRPSVPAPTQTINASQAWGLDPGLVMAIVTVDFMMSALDAMTFGLFFLFSIIAALGVSCFAYFTQKEKCGDSQGLAIGKSALIFVLLVLPTPIGGLLCVPSGISQFISNKRND